MYHALWRVNLRLHGGFRSPARLFPESRNKSPHKALRGAPETAFSRVSQVLLGSHEVFFKCLVTLGFNEIRFVALGIGHCPRPPDQEIQTKNQVSLAVQNL